MLRVFGRVLGTRAPVCPCFATVHLEFLKTDFPVANGSSETDSRLSLGLGFANFANHDALGGLAGRAPNEGYPMSSTMVQINVIPIRMLTMAEAARHCGRPISRFKVECPVE